MKLAAFFFGVISVLLLAGLAFSGQAATLESQVEPIFKQIFGRAPTASEKVYWVGRVKSGEKKTEAALRGAMYYQKAKGANGKSTAPITKDALIIETLPLFVKIFGNNPSNSEKAWWRKRIACGEIKSLEDLRKSMEYHRSKKVRKGSDAICGQKASAAAVSTSGVTKRPVAGIEGHVMGPSVRIGIFKTDGKAIVVTANNKFQVREGQSKILATVGKDDDVHISWSGGKYHVRGSGLKFDTAGKIRLVPLNGGITQIKNYSDPSATYPGKNYNRFRGVIEVRKCDGCNELWAINELRTEYYLRGIAETSGNGPIEYNKALLTAARTYVLYHKVVTGGRYAKQDFDINNTPNDQLYRGYEYELIAPILAESAQKTKGVIVTNGEGDKPIVTVYFSDSDGRTRSAKEAWNSSRFPHLQSVDDPHHQASRCVGHCVGLSAQGAFGLAKKDNFNFQKILNYYYQGIKLVRAY